MSSSPHELLWQRLQIALVSRDAFSFGTPYEIAAYAQKVLGNSLVFRFLDEYYLARKYGGVEGKISDRAAEEIVAAIETASPAPDHHVSAIVDEHLAATPDVSGATPDATLPVDIKETGVREDDEGKEKEKEKQEKENNKEQEDSRSGRIAFLIIIVVVVAIVIAVQGNNPATRVADQEKPSDVAQAPGTAEDALNLDLKERSEVQSGLTALSFDTGGVDGLFGPKTRSAIARYQSERGLESTGFLTASTVRRIKGEAEALASQGVQLVVCNKYDLTLFVAVGYMANEKWSAEGWWKVAPNECLQAGVHEKLSGAIYGYAASFDASNKMWIPGKVTDRAAFCVEPGSAFTLDDGACEGTNSTGLLFTDFGLLVNRRSGKFTWSLAEPTEIQ